VTIASQIGRAEPGDFLTGGRRDNTRVFRAAMRHSRFVRLLRLALPLAVIVSAAGIGAYRWLDPLRALDRLPVGAEGAVLSGTKIIMRQPRLKGFTNDQRPYTVVARTAAKDLAKPDELEMEDVHATLVMQDKRDVQITAREGFYDGKANTVRLKHNVVVSSPDYEVLLHEALVEVRKGHVVSEHPVVVNMLQGTINANRLEIHESGAVIRFERGVTLVIDREDTPAIVSERRR
jgi:lipopolysaccharide export system protein LptC